MTCIVGLITESQLIFGADSLVTTDSDAKFTLSDKKIFKKGKFLFGFCGSLRYGQLIKHKYPMPTYSPTRDIESYVHRVFLPDLHSFLAAHTYQKLECPLFEFLVGIGDRIFIVSDDFSVVSTPSPYQAIGSGSQYALGALFASQDNTNHVERLTVALQAASKYSQSVAEPFYFQSLSRSVETEAIKPTKKRHR